MLTSQAIALNSCWFPYPKVLTQLKERQVRPVSLQWLPRLRFKMASSVLSIFHRGKDEPFSIGQLVPRQLVNHFEEKKIFHISFLGPL